MLTQADCAAFASLPLVGLATRGVFGEDLLLADGVDYRPCMRLIGERPSAKKVLADRKRRHRSALLNVACCPDASSLYRDRVNASSAARPTAGSSVKKPSIPARR
ncbi:MAG: glutathione S-transferase [Polaromonas sp.]|nr:glutathione S-transferase [Polaromonas sp.]